MVKTEEKRRFVRLNVLTDVAYTRRPSSEEEKISLSKNISIGGLCLIVYETLKESEVLDLNIYLSEEAMPVNAVGRVVWSKEFIVGDPDKGKRYDVGIELIEINEEDVAKIEKYVFAHLK